MDRLLMLLVVMMLVLGAVNLRAEDTLPPLKDGKIPTNLDELWGNYDPRKEPLETQMVREWKEGGITFRLVIYTIGTFVSHMANLAAGRLPILANSVKITGVEVGN